MEMTNSCYWGSKQVFSIIHPSLLCVVGNIRFPSPGIHFFASDKMQCASPPGLDGKPLMELHEADLLPTEAPNVTTIETVTKFGQDFEVEVILFV